MANSETMLLRCAEDGEPLIDIAHSEMGAVMACPICGAWLKTEKIAEDAPRIISGILSEEQLLGLQSQIRASRK
jgi:hypothetical protein